MRIAYLDCFAGISGDMFLGALLHAGVPLAVLQEATAALGLNASLRTETVDRSGISATNAHVFEADHIADAPHTHPHNSEKVHGRSLTDIRALIRAANLAEPIQHFALHAFELLGESEARIHNVPLDKIHFHEVGAVDAIIDIVATSAGIHHLGINMWHCSVGCRPTPHTSRKSSSHLPVLLSSRRSTRASARSQP